MNHINIIALTKLFFKWIYRTQIKFTGIVYKVYPEDHPDTCECSRKCVKKGMKHNAALNNWALMGKVLRYYKCKYCTQGFYSWKKRKICKKFSCFLLQQVSTKRK